MFTSKDTYTLTQTSQHPGLFAGLTISVLALIAVSLYHNWTSPLGVTEPTVFAYQFVDDVTPFQIMVSDVAVTPEQARRDAAYYESVKNSVVVTPNDSNEDGVEQLARNEYQIEESVLVEEMILKNPFTYEILGVNLDAAYNAPEGSEIRVLSVPVINELVILLRDTQNLNRPTARERFPETEQYTLPYTSVLTYRYPSSHVALTFLARDLALASTPIDDSLNDFYLLQANQELKNFIDSGIFLGLYTLSDVQTTERFYQMFIEQVKKQAPYGQLIRDFTPLYTL